MENNIWISPIKKEDKINLFNPFLKYHKKTNKYYQPKKQQIKKVV